MFTYLDMLLMRTLNPALLHQFIIHILENILRHFNLFLSYDSFYSKYWIYVGPISWIELRLLSLACNPYNLCCFDTWNITLVHICLDCATLKCFFTFASKSLVMSYIFSTLYWWRGEKKYKKDIECRISVLFENPKV